MRAQSDQGSAAVSDSSASDRSIFRPFGLLVAPQEPLEPVSFERWAAVARRRCQRAGGARILQSS